MDLLLQAIALGIVQGLTEFLPISSSGHLIIVPAVFGWRDPFIDSLGFTVMLHLGTLIALIAYFWRDWLRLIAAAGALLRERTLGDDPDRRLVVLIAITTVPAAAAGVLLNDLIDRELRSVGLVAAMLVVGASILWFAERWGRRDRTLAEITPATALAIGIAQAAALVPGISRSGITISGGMFAGLDRESAARFAFLMAGPITGGAVLFEARKLFSADAGLAGHGDLLVAGVVASLISGILAIRFLLAYVRRRSLFVFIGYRVLLAGAIAIWLLS